MAVPSPESRVTRWLLDDQAVPAGPRKIPERALGSTVSDPSPKSLPKGSESLDERVDLLQDDVRGLTLIVEELAEKIDSLKRR